MLTKDGDGIVMKDVRLRLGSKDFDFHCTLPKAAITAVAGPSGSGKSTLLNLIAGFETPDSGTVLIDGVDMAGLHPSERPISLIFQDNNLFAHLDIFTNVGLGISPSLKLSQTDRQRVCTALQRVGLGGFEKRMPGTLSGGERQRAAFARALVRQRPVLLLDEPFAALDPDLRASMADLLLELHRESGNTIVMVTHDADELRRLANHAVYVDQGRIAIAAPLNEFIRVRELADVDGKCSRQD
ncbi:ATP-binding cassette domain-containing protein [Rhizobiaceae bacterium n13]|uniref:ATP-binding cassette domain-containing protein n=1 Tax=Ferirhizobium litorale TaxID=2927786 RepID=A0AAE3QHA8_9HYPH|nr:ATP-binding cassette domain-containing protein [Fererhizobium litorale]MDI7864872.1 ATP-binding cassette domain-containing protein [Fererhizobium litorale]MDI7923118.1 ATP-binding cassette domain-containing protein [Fererhizobium litorale]